MKREKVLQMPSPALLVSLSAPANNESLVSLISQKHVWAIQQGQQKKKATFHFRVHSVPKICKVLNQEAALSQRHTEPFIPILGENNHKEISQPAQLIKHRAWGYMCIQPYFPGFRSQALKPLPGAPEFNRWTLGFPDAPSSYGFDL